MAGLDVDTQSLSRAFTTRSLDYETQYTYSYSKIVGLQAGGDWELKRDYIQLKENQQNYDKYYSVNHYSTKANEKYSIIRYKKEMLSSDLISTEIFFKV